MNNQPGAQKTIIDLDKLTEAEKRKLELQCAVQTVQLLATIIQQNAKMLELMEEDDDDDDEEEDDDEQPATSSALQPLPAYAQNQRNDLQRTSTPTAEIVERVVEEREAEPTRDEYYEAEMLEGLDMRANRMFRSMAKPNPDWEPPPPSESA